MLLTAHQPTYLPWAGLLGKIAAAEHYISFDICPMESSGFENRVRIKTATGPLWLTVPVKRSREARIEDIEIAHETPWERKHWRTLEQAYAKAPFWCEYKDRLAQAYSDPPYRYLCSMDMDTTGFLLEAFGITIRERMYASELKTLSGAKSELVLSMCREVGAKEYLFGKLGADYCDRGAFKAAGIKVRFQDYQCIEYPQLHGGPFVLGLSALDLLLNVGPEKGREIILAGNRWTE